MDFLLWEKCYALPGSDSADYKCCLLEVILGMVQELGSCCGLCEADMDWEGTSQVPELGFSVTRRSLRLALGQRKFPELSTCNVTLITQWDKQKGGYWSRLLPGWLSCHLRFPYFFYLYFLWASKNPNFTTENRWEGVSSLDSNCPQGLTHLSEPARDSWNTKKGFYDNSSATLPSACVLWERRRQRLSHRHLGLFSPLCSGEIVPLEHTNGLRSFH